MKLPVDSFLQLLSEAKDDRSRESVFAANEIAGERVEAFESARGQPCFEWLALRLSATKPGEPLPSHEQAFRSVLSDPRNATAAEAYVVVMGPPLPREAAMAALGNATMKCLGAEGAFGSWLLRRFFHALIAVGRGPDIWPLVDELKSLEDPAHAGLLEQLLPLRPYAGLFASQPISEYFEATWRLVAPPAMPKLPPARVAGLRLSTDDAVYALRAAGAVGLADAISEMNQGRRDRAEVEASEFVRLVREAVAAGLTCLSVECSPPEGIEAWIQAELSSGRLKAASLAVRALWKQRGVSPAQAAAVLTQDVRAADIPALVEAFGAHEVVVERLVAVQEVCRRLSPGAADSAAFFLIPARHWDPARFNESVEDLDEIARCLESGPESFRVSIQAVRDAVAGGPKRAAAEAGAIRWLAAVEDELARLRDPRHLDESSVLRLVRELRLPEDGAQIAESIRVRFDDVGDLRVQLIAALVLVDAEKDPICRQSALFRAVGVIGRMNALPLMSMRIRLLQALRTGPRLPELSRERLSYWLGRTWSLLGHPEEAVPCLKEALDEAHSVGDLGLEVAATLDWAEAYQELVERQGQWPHEQLDAVIECLERLAGLDIADLDRGRVEASMLRFLEFERDPDKAHARRGTLIASLKQRRQQMSGSDRANVTVQLASALCASGARGDAITLLHDALDNDLPGQDTAGIRARLLALLGKAYVSEGENDRAMAAFTAAARVARRTNNDEIIVGVEWEMSLAVQHAVGIRYYRLPHLTRAREAAERLGDPVKTCELGLEEARCCREPWQAVVPLLAVRRSLELIPPGPRRESLKRGYHMYRERHGCPDPPIVILPSAPPPTEPVLLDERVLPLLARRQHHEPLIGDVARILGPGVANPEAYITACEQDVAASARSGDPEARIVAGLNLLHAAILTHDAQRVDDLARAAIATIDDAIAVVRPIDALDEELGDACLRVADRLLPEDGRFVDGAEAARVCDWVVRALGSVRQRELARFDQPSGVTRLVWEGWEEAHRYGAPALIEEALKEVRRHAPEFLAFKWDLSVLESRLGDDGHLVAAVVLPDALGDVAAGRRYRTEHILLDGSRSPAGGLSWRAARVQPGPWPCFRRPASPTWAEREAIDHWVRRRLLPSSGEIPATGARAVAWCAKGPAEAVIPTSIWPDAAQIVVTSSPALPREPAGARRRSTLITFADPGATARGTFGPKSRRFLEQLTRAAAGGPTTVLAAIGERHGVALGTSGSAPPPIEAVPSPGSFLLRQVEHDLIVLMAHGASDGAEKGALELVDYGGASASLRAASLAETPGLFDGASVLLLSCQAGRGGGTTHRPGGLAGAFLVAGAREVVAPLCSVGVDVAVSLAVPLIREYVRGRRLSEALTPVLRACTRLLDDGPSLGPIDPDEAARELRSFVSWVG